MSAFDLSGAAPPGSLLDKKAGHKPRSKRQFAQKHLAFIRRLPCCSCHRDPAGEAAHVRMACAEYGKEEAGVGRKPDDRWTVPLCRLCHQDAPQAQHRIGERRFWRGVGIDSFQLAMALWSAEGDVAKARNIIFTAKARLPYQGDPE